jgi:hypothetical protein
VCDLETSRIGAPYIYDISHLRAKLMVVIIKESYKSKNKEQQGIFLQNDTYHTYCMAVYSYMVNYKSLQ